MQEKHLVIISGNDSSLPKVSPPNTKITLIQTADRATDWQKKYVDSYIEVEEINEDTLLEVLRSIHLMHPVTGLVCFLEPVILVAARVANMLGIRSNPLCAVSTARDKTLTRQALDNANIPQRPWRMCGTPEEVLAFWKELGEESVVIKPITGAGSAGVRRVKNEDEVRAHLAEISSLHSWALLDNPDLLVLVEAVLPGREFSVEAMTVDGSHEVVQITEKITSGPPRYVEMGHWQPAELNEQQKDQISRRVPSILDAIGHRIGPSHTEIMVDGEDVWLVETHTRFGGDQIWELTELTTGRHMATETIFAILDLPLPAPGPRYSESAIFFMSWASHSEVPVIPGLIRVKHPSRRELIRKDQIIDSSTRTGYALAAGPNAASNALSAVKALQKEN